MLRLSGLTPFAKGGMRMVFAHPDDPSLIVKVLKPEILARWRSRSMIRRMRRTGPYRVFFRELEEQIALINSGETDLSFVQQIVGMAHSDMGPAVMSTAILDANGKYAPTIRELVRTNGLTSELEERLEDFCQKILSSSVIVEDLNPGNIVHGSEDGSAPRLVLIDGVGEKNWVPMNSVSPAWNRRTKLRQIRRLKSLIERTILRAKTSIAI